jgi:hypothetical protein
MNSQTIIYNNKSIRQILSNMPDELKKFKIHRNMYIQNCIEVYKSESSKTNLNYAELIRHSNFLIIQFYLNLKN